ncbi:neuromedin-S isoform X2 [Pantherophis guttatus]|uniref:Neuromedin-S n=1 Tax=Pantherophis guttatus TaxID=94885 RepID=A0A6P9D4V1_PANGU|nr:neuromedin-S isoform X2 [Pantherophis guttatus]
MPLEFRLGIERLVAIWLLHELELVIHKNLGLIWWMKMKQSFSPFPLVFVICFCMGQFTSGFPQTFASYLDESNVPKNERLALCFSQWTELFEQSQISSAFLDFCNSIFDSLQIDEENNQELYKRFLFHYSRAQDPTYPLKTGSFPLHPLMSLAPKLSDRRKKRFLNPELQFAAAEFMKKDGLDDLGRSFFLFRPRNGRTVDIEDK